METLLARCFPLFCIWVTCLWQKQQQKNEEQDPESLTERPVLSGSLENVKQPRLTEPGTFQDCDMASAASPVTERPAR